MACQRLMNSEQRKRNHGLLRLRQEHRVRLDRSATTRRAASCASRPLCFDEFALALEVLLLFTLLALDRPPLYVGWPWTGEGSLGSFVGGKASILVGLELEGLPLVDGPARRPLSWREARTPLVIVLWPRRGVWPRLLVVSRRPRLSLARAASRRAASSDFSETRQFLKFRSPFPRRLPSPRRGSVVEGLLLREFTLVFFVGRKALACFLSASSSFLRAAASARSLLRRFLAPLFAEPHPLVVSFPSPRRGLSSGLLPRLVAALPLRL